MTGSRGAPHRSAAEAGIKSDLAKVDAHEITPEEYDEIPELTDDMIARANVYVGGHLVGRGLPDAAEGPASIRLLPAVIDHFRASGPGWQARVNRILMDVVRRENASGRSAKPD